MTTTTDSAPEGFSKAAESYDAAVRHNIAGSRAAGDVAPRRATTRGCSTSGAAPASRRRRCSAASTSRRSSGWIRPRGCWRSSPPSSDEFPGVRVELRAEDVMEMGVEDGAFDAVISAMALHWFPDKPGAVARMARALRPGGVMGILTAGRGGEDAWRELLERVGAPPAWTGWFAENQRDVDEIAADLRAAGLEPIDVWMERRRRRTPPDAFMARTRSVAGAPARQPARRVQRARPAHRCRAARRLRPGRVRLRLLQALRGGAQAVGPTRSGLVSCPRPTAGGSAATRSQHGSERSPS